MDDIAKIAATIDHCGRYTETIDRIAIEQLAVTAQRLPNFLPEGPLRRIVRAHIGESHGD